MSPGVRRRSRYLVPFLRKGSTAGLHKGVLAELELISGPRCRYIGKESNR